MSRSKVKGHGHHGQNTRFSTDISGTAEPICDHKFTRKTCLLLRSDEFEGQGQSHQGQNTAFFGPFGGLGAVYVWRNIFSLWLLSSSVERGRLRRVAAAELTWFDRDWYRIGALDCITTAAYMLLVLIAVTSAEELLLMVGICRIGNVAAKCPMLIMVALCNRAYHNIFAV